MQPLLADTFSGSTQLTDFGRIARQTIGECIDESPCLSLEGVRVFPDHVHLIVRVHPFSCSCWRESDVSPWDDQAEEEVLKAFIRMMKRRSQKKALDSRPGRKLTLWSTEVFDHRVRSEKELQILKQTFTEPVPFFEAGWDLPEGDRSL